jgi:hypothetical protein
MKEDCRTHRRDVNEKMGGRPSEKMGGDRRQFEGHFPSGAKAPNRFGQSMYGLKPVPFKLSRLKWMAQCNSARV